MFEINKELASKTYTNEWVEFAAWYRSLALETAQNPDAILKFSDHKYVQKRIEIETFCSAVKRAQMLEALSYGDPGVLLSAPGSSLSGVLLNEIGSPQQKEYFFNYIKDNACRSFFAVTEPEKGSDAANMAASLNADMQLSGEKILFGNGAVAPIGTVLFKQGSGMLGMCAAIITPELLSSGSIKRMVLPTYGLRGAQISYMHFANTPIEESLLLGQHLSPVERGMMSMLKTFHRYRPGVSALAIGQAQAMVDYVRLNCNSVSVNLLNKYDHQLAIVREQNLSAAAQVDIEPLKGAVVSLIKAKATSICEEISQGILSSLQGGQLLEHPWLMKSAADMYGYEYMEGTTHIHHLNVDSGLKRNEFTL
ncbi:acyl-CoA dehydrogenase family protein [Pseudoalteromonas aurantia]|uniref:Acyl-CoA oxidase/dehydrogenase middle domain-containing protein n=1 Tax=Pseudoalteromonas aurantia 208 TaxID=1314867 RepID=A0ABR9E603_9GAMM|nr:acyl-CoA dehydrogenase family protein [Pseudoalteromonas aurantia]MBE0366418.1 hypothetical protein [Pseudoalteromonas aurantia 208]